MKVTKRDFVKGAAAAAVVVATVSKVTSMAPGMTVAGAGDSLATRAQPFDLVVFNDLFPQAHAFAIDLTEQGARAVPIAGDAGSLWYETLRGLVAGGQRRIAGLTTHTDLFILETLAREKGLRVSQREPVGRLVSWVLL